MFGKFVVRVIVGLLVATVFTGGQALALAAMAVVCTAGVGLIVVLPAAYFLGLVCTIWFIPFGSGAWSYAEKRKLEAKETRIGTKNPARVKLSAEHSMLRAGLVNYITNVTRRGTSWEEIRNELVRNGWAEPEIDAVYETVRDRELKLDTY